MTAVSQDLHLMGVSRKSYFQECLKVGLIIAVMLTDFIMEKLMIGIHSQVI